MKKVLFLFVIAMAVAFLGVSCTSLEDDGNRVAITIGTIYDNQLVDDQGGIVKLVNKSYPNKTRGYFSVSYNVADVVTDENGKVTSINNAKIALYDQFVVFNTESSAEAEAKGVDITKLDGYDEHLYCHVSGGYLQVDGYDRYENDSLYHVVYDVQKQKKDTLRLTLCNTGKAVARTRLMHVDYDLTPVSSICQWNDSLVISLDPAQGKSVIVKVAKKDLKKPLDR